MSNPKSTASIAGHPIHPMLIPFPIAFFVATFVCDLAYWQSPNDAWVTATLWLLGAGLVIAVLAAVAGLTDVLAEPRIRALNDAWWHAGGNVLVVLIELYNFYARYSEGSSAIVPKGLVLSLIVVCILLFTGWKGWEMVYRYRVGVADAADSPSATTAQPRRVAQTVRLTTSIAWARAKSFLRRGVTLLTASPPRRLSGVCVIPGLFGGYGPWSNSHVNFTGNSRCEEAS
jgi:uncharacterized membrane protein